MTTEPSKVTATAGATADSVLVYHNDFPDLRADGYSLEDAAANLVQDLTRVINDTEDDAHRADLRQAIADVQAFIERPRPAEVGRPSREDAGRHQPMAPPPGMRRPYASPLTDLFPPFDADRLDVHGHVRSHDVHLLDRERAPIAEQRPPASVPHTDLDMEPLRRLNVPLADLRHPVDRHREAESDGGGMASLAPVDREDIGWTEPPSPHPRDKPQLTRINRCGVIPIAIT